MVLKVRKGEGVKREKRVIKKAGAALRRQGVGNALVVVFTGREREFCTRLHTHRTAAPESEEQSHLKFRR